MIRKILLLVFFLAGFLQIFAQERTISGIVTSASDGKPLPGVSIGITGIAVGTITNMDGFYSLSVGSEATSLKYSFIGMMTEVIKIGQQTTINVVMEENAMDLDEVVVTALAIKKEKKSLGYAISNLKSAELIEGNQTNLVNALQGKVAGVTVTNSGGAPGASSVILIRGGNSLSGNNQPLFVVDGIPIDNSTVGGGDIAHSNRALDINSADVESVSILKGAAAAAMYGIKAANGAVIITTKSGKAGEAKISYSGSYSIDEVMGVPEIQKIYGPGTMTGSGINPLTTFSWDTTLLADNVSLYNNLEDFYQRGYTSNHNLSYSGGSDKSTIYASFGRLDQEGVIDRTKYERTSFKVNSNSSLKDNLTIGTSFNYVNSASDRTRQGSANSGGFRSILNYPSTVDMSDYLNEDGTQKTNLGLATSPDNPYWSAINNPIANQVDRFIGQANLSYDPFKFLNISYRLGSDIFMEKNKSSYASGAALSNSGGQISEYEIFNRITTSTLMLNLNHKVEKNNFGLTVGNNVEDYFRRRTNWGGKYFIEPDFVGIENILPENRTVGQDVSMKRIVSAFGEFRYDWNSQIFLNATYRLDITSTILDSPSTDERDNAFSYPSLGLSVLASDIMDDMGITFLSDLGIDYWKLRTTIARAGKDAPPHVTYTPMLSSTNTYTVDPQGFMRATFPAGNPGLLPEFTNSFEIGTDIRLFQNRVGIDFSYYNNTTDNQILDIRMPPSTSTWSGYLNGGAITNKGIELLLTTKIVRKTDFSWGMDINYAKATSHVSELPGEIKQVENSDAWAFNNIGQGAAFLNGSVFGIYGYAYLRDDDGNLLLTSTGMVQKTTVFENIGDRYPDWSMGITNKFQYKNLILNFLVDVSVGNEVLNATRTALVYYGLDPMTIDRGESYVFEGLRPDGTVDTDGNPNLVQNDLAVVLDQEYYQNIYSTIGENFIEDASWVRLRYVTLTYNLPTKWFGDKISMAQVNVTGRNLIVLTPYSGIDPEINTIGAAVNGTGSIGVDNLGTPSTKGVDFSLRFTF